MAIGLLANPQVQSDPVFKAQALAFAGTAMSLTQQALQNSSSTDISTSTPIQIPDLPTSTVAQNPIYIYVPYVPPVATSTFGASNPASTSTPVAPNPIAPTAKIYNFPTSGQFVFSGGDYDKLQLVLSIWNTQSQSYVNPTIYDVSGNPFTLTGLTTDATYKCEVVASKGGIVGNVKYIGSLEL